MERGSAAQEENVTLARELSTAPHKPATSHQLANATSKLALASNSAMAIRANSRAEVSCFLQPGMGRINTRG